MKAGGGARDGSYGGSSSSISAGWVAVEGTGAPGEAAVNMLPEAQDEDVPNTVDYNGEVIRGGRGSRSKRMNIIVESVSWSACVPCFVFSFTLP